PVSRRTLAFIVILACCVGGAGAYVLHAVRRAAPEPTGEQASPPADGAPAPILTPGDAPPPGLLLVFRRTALDRWNGALGVAPVSEPTASRIVTTLRCERVHMAAGQGVCLSAQRGVFTTYRAELFDQDFRPRGTLPLA